MKKQFYIDKKFFGMQRGFSFFDEVDDRDHETMLKNKINLKISKELSDVQVIDEITKIIKIENWNEYEWGLKVGVTVWFTTEKLYKPKNVKLEVGFQECEVDLIILKNNIVI